MKSPIWRFPLLLDTGCTHRRDPRNQEDDHLLKSWVHAIATALTPRLSLVPVVHHIPHLYCFMPLYVKPSQKTLHSQSINVEQLSTSSFNRPLSRSAILAAPTKHLLGEREQNLAGSTLRLATVARKTPRTQHPQYLWPRSGPSSSTVLRSPSVRHPCCDQKSTMDLKECVIIGIRRTVGFRNGTLSIC